MTSNYALLDIAKDRLHFWQGRLQAAFRDANSKEAAACELMIDEYALLIREVMQQLRRSAPGESPE
jgi:hypothetical protein